MGVPKRDALTAHIGSHRTGAQPPAPSPLGGLTKRRPGVLRLAGPSETSGDTRHAEPAAASFFGRRSLQSIITHVSHHADNLPVGPTKVHEPAYIAAEQILFREPGWKYHPSYLQIAIRIAAGRVQRRSQAEQNSGKGAKARRRRSTPEHRSVPPRDGEGRRASARAATLWLALEPASRPSHRLTITVRSRLAAAVLTGSAMLPGPVE